MKKTLLLALALFFVPQLRADSVNFNLGNGTWVWSMPQDAVPDQGSVATGEFTFLQVPVFTSVSGMVQTFDLNFFADSETRNFILTCDPFGFNIAEPAKTCDYFECVQIAGNSGIWAGSDRADFVPGSYNGLVISTTEPSTFALLGLGLLAARIRARRSFLHGLQARYRQR